MATVGRKRLSDQVKKARGTLRKDRTTGKVQQAPEPLKMAHWVGSTAQPYFDALRDELELVGLNSRTYSIVVSLTASVMRDIHLYEEIIAQDGHVLHGDHLMRLHPLSRAIAELRRHLQSLISEIGLTASAGARIASKVKPAEKSGFEKL